MKKHFVMAALLAAAATTAQAQGKHEHAHEHKPLHGGLVVESRDVDYELVARDGAIQLYLRDHGKPMAVGSASAKLTLLAGSEKQEVVLKPVGDRLEAQGAFKLAPGTKVVAVVSNAGKTLGTARFTLE